LLRRDGCGCRRTSQVPSPASHHRFGLVRAAGKTEGMTDAVRAIVCQDRLTRVVVLPTAAARQVAVWRVRFVFGELLVESAQVLGSLGTRGDEVEVGCGGERDVDVQLLVDQAGPKRSTKPGSRPVA
jgi:hypothetical protein